MLNPLPERARSIVESAARLDQKIADYDKDTPNNNPGLAGVAMMEARYLHAKLTELIESLEKRLPPKS